jgi:hypothetical protein
LAVLAARVSSIAGVGVLLVSRFIESSLVSMGVADVVEGGVNKSRLLLA